MLQVLHRWWPLGVGLSGGLIGLWWRGGLWVLDGQPAGYHWPARIYSAWSWQQGHAAQLDAFRDPLHSVLVGLLGPELGFANAGLLVAGLSMVVTLLCATHIATLLAGRHAGMLTALCIPLAPLAASGSRWATEYPLLTAGLTASLAAALHFAHTARPAALGAWAVATVLACWTDDRGLLALPTLLLLAAGCWGRSRRVWTAVAGVAITAWAVGQAGPALVGQDQVLSWTEKRSVQTRVVQRWSTQTMNADMKAACSDIPESVLLTPGFLTTPCAPAIADHNRTHALPGITAWPPSLLLVSMCILLLAPARRLRGLYVATLLAIGLPAAVFTPWPARYQLLFIGVLAPLVPVALRVLLPTDRRGVAPAGALLALLAVWLWDPHQHARHPVQGIDARWRQPGVLATALRSGLAPTDRVVDCAHSFVEIALLPDHRPPMGPNLSIPDLRPCRSWMATVPNRAVHWLLIPGPSSPEATEASRSLHEELAQSAAWQVYPVAEFEQAEVTAWRRTPPGH